MHLRNGWLCSLAPLQLLSKQVRRLLKLFNGKVLQNPKAAELLRYGCKYKVGKMFERKHKAFAVFK